MTLLSAEQIRAWDKYTIENEPIASYDLMERASLTFTYWFTGIFDSERTVYVFCGTGNNGGDGMAIARLLHYRFFNVLSFICRISPTESPDFLKNVAKLPARANILKGDIKTGDNFITIPKGTIIIDAILGSGLTRPVEGYWAEFFQYLSNSGAEIVSVDIPSGLFSDKHTPSVNNSYGVVCAHQVLSFEIPKLAFFMPENYRFVRHFDYKSIGLSPDFLSSIPNHNIMVTKEVVSQIHKRRNKFAHKGHFGHALLVCGSKGMAGAAILSARSCLRSGVGLLTLHTPKYNMVMLQTAVPEAMCQPDVHDDVITDVPNTDSYSAIGVGCGISKNKKTVKALKRLLEKASKPMVVDADALNIIAENPLLMGLVPPYSILTPHPKEFQRLFGKVENDFDRLELLRTKAQQLQVNIVLKGAYTIVANTEGVCFFNTTGNPGMASAGSGDVLTGVITALLAQGYAPSQAAILGVYLHGTAGDLATQQLGEEALIASDIVEHLGTAFKALCP